MRGKSTRLEVAQADSLVIETHRMFSCGLPDGSQAGAGWQFDDDIGSHTKSCIFLYVRKLRMAPSSLGACSWLPLIMISSWLVRLHSMVESPPEDCGTWSRQQTGFLGSLREK